MKKDNGDAALTLAIGGLLVGVATVLGAFGTHALKPTLAPARFDSFEIAVTYQFFHAIGLLLFCGSIQALTFGAPRFFGMVAPLGGVSLMSAWLVFALACWRLRGRRATP